MNIEKYVKDPKTGEWVKKIKVPICTNLKFRTVIRNDDIGVLTHISVVDVFSESLDYNNNATVTIIFPNGLTTWRWEPVKIGPNTCGIWRTSPYPQRMIIEYHVFRPGEDINYVEMNATLLWDNCTSAHHPYMTIHQRSFTAMAINRRLQYLLTDMYIPRVII